MARPDKRKRIPYAINGLLDEGLMANADALHALEPLIEGRKLDALDQQIRVGRAVNNIYKNDRALREIKSIQQQGKDE